MAKPIEFHYTLRDFVQSNLGTWPAAEEIVAPERHVADVGLRGIQTTFGTFFSVIADKGRDPWQQNRVLANAFPTMQRSGLWRNDATLHYERKAQLWLHRLIEEIAADGLVHELENFHGENDPRTQVETVKAARANGIKVRGAICFDKSKGHKIDDCVRAAQTLLEQGHTGLYIKVANGQAFIDATYELLSRLRSEFGETDIRGHAHTNNKLGYAIYAAMIEGGIDCLDVVPPAYAEGTGLPNIVRVMQLIDKIAPERYPSQINMDALMADEPERCAFRFSHRMREKSYNTRRFDAMERAGGAGGAATTLASIPGLRENVAYATNNSDPDQNEIDIYNMRARIQQRVLPTAVTPYDKILSIESGAAITREAQGQDPFAKLTPPMADFLSGRLGSVPRDVDLNLKAQAMIQTGLVTKKELEDLADDDLAAFLESREDFVPSAELKTYEKELREKLAEEGVTDPTRRELVTAAILSDLRQKLFTGVNHVVSMRNGSLEPPEAPVLPKFLQPLHFCGNRHGKNGLLFIYEYDVAMALGGAAELERIALAVLELEKRGFYKTGYDEDEKPNTDAAHRIQENLVELYDDFIRQAHHDVEAFIEDIPRRFQEYGISAGHLYGASVMAQRILEDVCTHKGVSKEVMPDFGYAIFKRYDRSLSPNSGRFHISNCGITSARNTGSTKPWGEDMILSEPAETLPSLVKS